MKKNNLIWSLCLMSLLSALPAMAHRSHCHLKDAQGNLIDSAEFKKKQSCLAKGGEWKHHHDHCHKTGAEHVDMPEHKSKKACLAASGSWSDHGHEHDHDVGHGEHSH